MRGSVYLLINRSWICWIGTGLRKCSFWRPDLWSRTMPASSSTSRCLATSSVTLRRRSPSTQGTGHDGPLRCRAVNSHYDRHTTFKHSRPHNEVVRFRFLIHAGMLFVWVTLVAIVTNFVLFPRIHSAWALTVVQVLTYGVLVLPVLMWARSTFRDFASPRWQRVAAVLLVIISLIVGSAVRHYGIELIGIAVRAGATAVGEEVIFRGFIWDRTRRAGWSAPVVIAVNVVAFTLWHIPSMLAGFSPASVGTAVALLLVGLILCVLRLVTRSLILPVAAHFAIDMF